MSDTDELVDITDIVVAKALADFADRMARYEKHLQNANKTFACLQNRIVTLEAKIK